jgi:hypothetical protein
MRLPPNLLFSDHCDFIINSVSRVRHVPFNAVVISNHEKGRKSQVQDNAMQFHSLSKSPNNRDAFKIQIQIQIRKRREYCAVLRVRVPKRHIAMLIQKEQKKREILLPEHFHEARTL